MSKLERFKTRNIMAVQDFDPKEERVPAGGSKTFLSARFR